jgi:hypothetical protein
MTVDELCRELTKLREHGWKDSEVSIYKYDPHDDIEDVDFIDRVEADEDGVTIYTEW